MGVMFTVVKFLEPCLEFQILTYTGYTHFLSGLIAQKENIRTFCSPQTCNSPAKYFQELNSESTYVQELICLNRMPQEDNHIFMAFARLTRIGINFRGEALPKSWSSMRHSQETPAWPTLFLHRRFVSKHFRQFPVKSR